jgi:Putative peptidoglycan binding domain
MAGRCIVTLGEGPLPAAPTARASFLPVGSVPLTMRRLILVLCAMSFASAWSARTVKAQTTTGSSTSSATHPATTKKAATKKHHHTSKFVPKQKAPTADRITEIQTALAHGGYYQGDPNGKWDTNTVGALQKFQSANGIEPSGKLDAPSLQKLGLGSDIAGVSAPRPITPATAAPQGGAPQNGPPPANSSNASPAPATSASISPSTGSIVAKPAQQ